MFHQLLPFGFSQQQLQLRTPADFNPDFVSCLTLQSHRYTAAPSPKLPTPPPAPPRRRRRRRRCCCCWCLLRMFLKFKNRLSVVMALTSHCQCIYSSFCRLAAAVDTTAAVPHILAGLSPASAPAAAAAAVCGCCWGCSHSLLRMFQKCAVFVALIMPCVDFSQTLMFPIPSPIGFFIYHGCLDSQTSLCGSVQFLVLFSAFFSFFIIMFFHVCSCCCCCRRYWYLLRAFLRIKIGCLWS